MRNFTTVGAFALAAIAASPCMANMQNGGFENGDFSNWSIRWGKTDGAPVAGKWISPMRWEDDVTWSGYQNWPGQTSTPTTTLKAKVINSSANVQSFVSAYNTPPEGSYQAVINYSPSISDIFLDGQSDVTHLRRLGVVDPSDIDPALGKYVLRVYWAGLLENPGHTDDEEPGFLIRLNRKPLNGVWGVAQEVFHEGNQRAAGQWILLPGHRTGGGNPGADIYTRSSQDSLEVQLGDSVSVDLVTIDCSPTGHGAVAFIDAVGFQRPACAWCTTIDTLGLPCLYGKENLTLSSNASVSSDMGSNVLLYQDADAKNTGSAFVRGSYTMRDRARLTGDARVNGTYNMANNQGNQAVITGLKGTKPFVFPGIPTYSVTPGTGSQYFNGPNPQTIVPGRYGNVGLNSGAKVTLTAGVYEFASLSLGANSSLVLNNTAGAIKIRVAGKIVVDNVAMTTIQPMKDGNTTVEFYSAYANQYDAAITIQAGSTPALGDFIAPNGLISVNRRNVLGYAHGKYAKVESSANFQCREGYLK